MCFSATASFTASFILLIIGLLSVRKVIRPRLYYIASVPSFFSIQQAAEGVVWLSLLGYTGNGVQQAATLVFLFFAIGVWPFWIPFSLMKAELQHKNRKILQILSMVGGVFCLSLVGRLFYYGAQASIANCHISYDYLNDVPDNFIILFFSLAYLLIVAASFFISTIAYMNFFGFGVVVSYIISYYFYYYNFGSVWCFFAAILSAGIYFIIDQEQKKVL